MDSFSKVVFCVATILVFINEGYGLTCLKCQSTDVNSRCRYGQRSKTATKKQICFGETAKCYVVATVNVYGEAYFQRGCTLEPVCAERDDTDIEYCFTCASKHCNYNVIQLDEEVEEYLNEVREYQLSNDSILEEDEGKTNNVSVNSQNTENPRGAIRFTDYPPKNNIQKQEPTKVVPQDSSSGGVSAPFTPNLYEGSKTEDIKSNESPHVYKAGEKDVVNKFKSNYFLDFGMKIPNNSQ